jgi:exopolyphosphatase/guanosine-5'-triphosphate,3'-diphosphate pyrophosphatase
VTRCARGVRRARLIATEACRAAENGEAFRARVAEQAGLELEIVDSATEARLAAAGCTELFDPAASRRHPVRYRRRIVGGGAAWPA